MYKNNQISCDVFHVTHSQMMEPRTPKDFLRWVEANRTELDSRPLSRVYTSSKKVLSKKFYEEARPISLYAYKKFGNREDVKITLHLENENYDAKIEIQEEKPEFIEVTYAKDGHDEALRMEVLLKQGLVSAEAPIKTNRKKGHKREIYIPGVEAVEHAKVVNNKIALVGKSLGKKAHKMYGKNSILLVIINDSTKFWHDEDVKLLDEAVKEKIKNLPFDFREIVIQNVEGKLLLSYPII